MNKKYWNIGLLYRLKINIIANTYLRTHGYIFNNKNALR